MRHPALVLITLSISASLTSAPAAAQFGGFAQQPIPVKGIDGRLEGLLTAELHFVKKVCDPTSKQFNQIHLAGIRSLKSIHSKLGGQPGRAAIRTAPANFDPSHLIAMALTDAVQSVMPSETWWQYRQEIIERANLRRQAGAAMIVQMIDREANLAPDQIATLESEIYEHWQPHMSDAQTVMLYPMYAHLPDPDVLRPHLTSMQQRLWAYRPNHRSIRVPWETQLGPANLFSEELDAFPDPVQSNSLLRDLKAKTEQAGDAE